MRKYLFFIWLACLPLSTRGQTLEDPDFTALLQPVGVQSLQYWFDDGTNSLKETNDIAGNYSFDVSTLEDGLHTLHCLVKGTNGELYGTSSKVFLILKGEELPPHASLEGAKLQYWFDEHGDALQTASGLSGVYKPDVSALADGLHVIHYVVVGADGKVYSTGADTFIKMAEMLNEEVVAAVKAKGIAYWFDDDVAHKKTSTDLSGTYSLDVSALEDGLHVLHYHIVGENNLPYGITSTMFLKNEAQFDVHEPPLITKYTYWLNHESSTAKTVTLDQPVNPYTLMSLLPLQRMPIRSSLFHFQVDDGVPTIYAKNTFNIRFYNSKGYFADNFFENEKTFIDYGVSQQITDAELLESGQTVTIDRPAENVIKWYRLTAVTGDSLEFKLDKAATIQLFSPSGAEVYNVSGAESVKVGGCHAWENGTYYLALHDVTATTGNTISLSYNHIDKYAVLRQNVKVVGNGGYTTITFDGNGFRDLYKIDIFDTEQNNIECLSLGIESNSCIYPTFDFTGVKLGVYDAIFHFTEGDVNVPNILTVQEATDLTIDTKLETPGLLFGRNRPYFDVTIVCPNGGNNTAYDVPVGVYLTAPKGAIDYIDISNKEIPTLAELLQNDEMSDADKLEVQQISDELGDTYDFYTKEYIDEKTGAEMETRFIYLTTTIAPESSNTIKLKVKAATDIKTTIDCPPEWMPIYMIEKRDPPKQKPKICGGLEKVKCFFDGAATITGWASAIGNFTPASTLTGAIDCATSSITTLIGNITESHCGGGLRETFSPISYRATQKALGKWGWAISCVSAMIPGGKVGANIAKSVVGAGTSAIQHDSAFEQCNSAFNNDISGISNLVYSKDPNDIYGYTSPSGTKFISQTVKDVSYTIEFENDPEEATAPAHDIYLTDELDASKFDLSTYKPTSIRIGNKTAELSGEKNFVTTIDMRPEIYAIAQVEGTFNESTGIAKWHISSLDPMTMEPTEEIFNGVLPVNTDGQGVGEVSFDISLKDGLTHGTEIPNKATIVFDTNDPIETPTWTNTIDAIRPVSHVVNVTKAENGMAEVTVEATDELSGTWRYDVYVQYGTGSAWVKMAENIPIDTKAKVKVYGGIDHGFYAVATDQAGNKEEKEPIRESSLIVNAILGDINGDEQVTAQDASLVLQHVAGKQKIEDHVTNIADINKDGSITAGDASLILQHVAGKYDW